MEGVVYSVWLRYLKRAEISLARMAVCRGVSFAFDGKGRGAEGSDVVDGAVAGFMTEPVVDDEWCGEEALAVFDWDCS